jgi:hypothetical protein
VLAVLRVAAEPELVHAAPDVQERAAARSPELMLE